MTYFGFSVNCIKMLILNLDLKPEKVTYILKKKRNSHLYSINKQLAQARNNNFQWFISVLFSKKKVLQQIETTGQKNKQRTDRQTGGQTREYYLSKLNLVP